MIIEMFANDIYLQKRFLSTFFLYDSVISLQEEYKLNPYLHYLVYQKDNKIVAFLNYSEIYDRIEINQIEVHKDYQSRGIATELLEELFKRSEKLKNITLEVNCENEKAIGLYLKCGFQKKAIRKNYYHGTDGILMEKEMVK